MMSQLRIVLGVIDWQRLLSETEIAQRLLTRPETWALYQAAVAMRDPLARILWEMRIITDDEARPSKEGGLGLVPLLRRALEHGQEEDS